MDLEDQLKKVFSNEKVLKLARAHLQTENRSGFLAHLSEENLVRHGRRVSMRDETYPVFDWDKLKQEDHVEIEKYAFSQWAAFAEEEVLRYFIDFRYQTEPLEGGLLVYTTWRFNELGKETTQRWMKLLSDKKNIIHPSLLGLSVHSLDALELNRLKKDYDNVVLVRGSIPAKNSLNANLLIMQQKVPQMTIEDLSMARLAGGYEQILPRLKDISNQFYLKLKGNLDLETGYLNLERL